MLLSIARKTLRDYRRAILGWGLGLAALTLMQLAVYPSVRSQGSTMRDLINSYPSALKAMFGMEGVDFTSGPGYLSTETFSLLAPLMLIGLGIALGAGAIAGEEENGTLDLLMASPVSRGRMLAGKALGALAALVTVAAGFYLTVLAAASGYGMGVGAGPLAQATGAVLLLAIACGAVAFLAGAATGKRGAAIGAGAGFAVVSYFIDSLAGITAAVRPWRVVSIFHQASATGALQGGLGVAGPLATTAFAAACLLGAWYLFARRDLAA
jgi:ABC-2 type transport system permease protein